MVRIPAPIMIKSRLILRLTNLQRLRQGLSPFTSSRESVSMNSHNDLDCEELLLDVVCYEKSCGRLSPEMEYLLAGHLDKCPSCRDRVLFFQRVVDGENTVRNFG
jgi:hypothetical protein